MRRMRLEAARRADELCLGIVVPVDGELKNGRVFVIDL
jgi:hypothetical protein